MIKIYILYSLLPMLFCGYAMAASEDKGMFVNGQKATPEEAMHALMWHPTSRGFNSSKQHFPHWSRSFTMQESHSIPMPKNLHQYLLNQEQTKALHNKAPNDVNIYFDSNAARLTNDAKQELRADALFLKLEATTMLHITGHADSRGSASGNRILSERRAQSVADFLEAVLPDLGGRIVVLGMGEKQPKFDTSGHEDFEKSRRVQFDIFSH